MAIPLTEDLAENEEGTRGEGELFQTYVSAYATGELGYELWLSQKKRREQKSI